MFLVAKVGRAEPAQNFSAAGDAGNQLEEIVVTARHREEAARRVPIALTVLNAAKLEETRTSNLVDLEQLVPSLQIIAFNPRNTNLTIRGLGSNIAIANDGLETGVGVYVDGVYYARPGESMFDLYDIDRVEVLRGPQGTLFGKNTTAGAIAISTTQPSFTPEGSAEASIGDYGYYQMRGVLSGPLVDDRLAGRISVYGTERDGFVKNTLTGQGLQDYGDAGVRAQLLFKPDDALSVRVVGDYGYQEENCCVNLISGVVATLANGEPFPNGFYARAARIGYVPPAIDPEARRSDVNDPVHLKMEQGGGSVQADWALRDTVLTSISAYRYWNWYPRNDFDDTAAAVLRTVNTPSRQRQASQEFRITSSTDQTVQYTGGLYYFHEDVQSSQLITYGPDAAGWMLPQAVPVGIGNAALNGFANAAHDTATTDSYAAYGQATWHIDDRWSATGGLRYTFETKDGMFAQQQQGGRPLGALPPSVAPLVTVIRGHFASPVAYEAGVAQGALSGTVSLSYQLADRTFTYATYAHGVKSGGLNLAALPTGVNPTIHGESIDNYELGLKTELLDRRLSIDAALYWANDSDYQAMFSDPVLLASYLANVGKVRSRGVEVDVRALPVDDLVLSFSAAYDDANYVSYPMGPCPLEQVTTPSCNLGGRPLPGAPRWSGSVGVEYDRPAGQLMSYSVVGYVGGQYSYRSSFFSTASDSLYSRIPGYGLLDIRIGARADDETWDLSFWVRNLTDTFYYSTLGAVALNSGAVAGIPGAPRTLGGTLRVKF